MGTLIKKDNAVIQANYNLTRLEQCCLLYCLTQINSDDTEFKDSYLISAVNFAEMFGIAKERSYLELKNIAKLLYSRSVTINKDRSRIETRWVSAIEYIEGSGTIEITLSQKIKPYLLQLKREFTSYDIRNITGFNSKYAIRIYEMIIQWKNSDHDFIEIQLVELRDRLKLEDKYTRVNDLILRVIEPAVSDINEYSNLIVKFEMKKRGHKFISVLFSFKEKKAKEQKEPTEIKKKQGKLSLDASAPSKKPDKMPRRFVDRFAPVGWSYDDCYASESLKQKWAECKDWIAYVK